MRIGVIVNRRYLRQSVSGAVIRALLVQGAEVDILCPEEGRFDARRGVLHTSDRSRFDLNRCDLVVSRSRDALGLATLAYVEAAGIPAVNSCISTRQVRNKADLAVALARAGIPTPPTLLADGPSALADLSLDWFPLILRAADGHDGRGPQLVRRPEDLADLPWDDDLVLARCHPAGHGFGLKLYVCGRAVFPVRRPSPFNDDLEATPRAAHLDASLLDLALRCGEVFGLEIYGVDVVETPEGPAVVDVDELPEFIGLAGAAERIARYLLGRAAGDRRDGAPRLLREWPATAVLRLKGA